MTHVVKAALIGCGGMARHHMRNILKANDTEFLVVSEPNDTNYQQMVTVFKEAGVTPPVNVADLAVLLDRHASELDAVFIITPHVYHFEQAKACLEAGLDVLLEKPMTMNAAEAEALIEVQQATGKLLVVAFNGSLSPNIREAVRLLRSGELGEVMTIQATVWQDWKQLTVGSWRQEPSISGGGFLFDSGAHMLNTLADLVGEAFTEVSAWLDNRNTPVDINGVVMARTRSGLMVTMHGCGEAIRSCHSDIRVFCSKGILRTGVWGERLELQRNGESDFTPIETPASLGSWQQFICVHRGEIPNPCPPVVGLRMMRLWDAIKASAAQGGRLVAVEQAMSTQEVIST